MNDVKSIEKAVQSLSASELAEFRRWFAEFVATAWDAQMECDAKAGTLDVFAAEAFAEFNAGKSREI
jgi:hypothetical protein